MIREKNSSRSLLGEERSYRLPNQRRPPAMATVRVTCPQYTPVLGGMLSLLVSCKNAAMREMEQGGFCHLPMPTLLVPQATVPFPPLCLWPFSSLLHIWTTSGHRPVHLWQPLSNIMLFIQPTLSHLGEQHITIGVEQTQRIVIDYLLRAESVGYVAGKTYK